MTCAVTMSGTRKRVRRDSAFQSAIRNPQFAIALLLLTVFLAVPGCGRGPRILPAELRRPIDRSVLERPAEFDVERFVESLTAPSAMAFDLDKNALLVAESGTDGREPRILGFDLSDGSTFRVYPQGKRFLGFATIPFRMYGPIGGMAVRDGVIYVSHRDADGMGVISTVGYDGKGKTVIAGLPAQGDYGVTDLEFDNDGRLYFGVGAATNSGVVGLDNWQAGWVQKHPKLADRLYTPADASARLLGSKFFTNNPGAGLFSGSELAITAPFQPFGEFTRSRIQGPADAKANAAIFSIRPTGGVAAPDFRIEAHGIRYPAGLVFDPRLNQLFATNQGMEYRGTRPVKDDPNVVLRVPLAGPQGPPRWWGWPDFSADLRPITDERFQPDDVEMLRRTGYTELNPLLEHNQRTPGGEQQFRAPDDADRDLYVRAVFPALSGAAKMTLLPAKGQGPFGVFDGRSLVVALSGDRAPYATSGKKLKHPVGFKVVRVADLDSDAKAVHDFLRNTAGVPRHLAGNNPEMLERPIDVKIGPDSYLYVLDFGRLDPRGGKKRVKPGTGQVFRMLPIGATGTPTTAPAPPANQ